jgi:hypothetical protein
MGRTFRSCRIYSGGLVLACVLLGSAAAQPAAADTLAGETFAADDNVPGQTVTVNCGPTPQSPFSYHAEGPATGPHLGTFTEDGTVDPADTFPPTIIALDATFTITSAQGNVTGEKHLVAPGGGGTCVNAENIANFGGAGGLICYGATFAGGGTEVGLADVGLTINEIVGGTIERQFVETFTPDATVVCGGPCDENAQVNQNQGGDNQGCKND